jgi:hypothetical protein
MTIDTTHPITMDAVFGEHAHALVMHRSTRVPAEQKKPGEHAEQLALFTKP